MDADLLQKTSQKTTLNTMSTSKITDDYMRELGYSPATENEIALYDKFTKRRWGFFSNLFSLLRQRAFGIRSWEIPVVPALACVRIEGAISLPDHQSEAESDTRQTESAQNEVFEEQSGHWRKADLAEPVLQY